MDKDLVVLVGKEYISDLKEDANAIANAIRSRGFLVERVENTFPRDDYIYCNGKYIRSSEHGDLGVGGFAHAGNGYVLFPDNISLDGAGLPRRSEIRLSDYRKRIRKTVSELFEVKVGILPVGIFNSRAEYDEEDTHVDTYTHFCPYAKLLIVNEYHEIGKLALKQRGFKKEIKKLGLELGIVSENGTNLNALSLPDNGRDIVFYRSEATELAQLLGRRGIEAIPIDTDCLIHCGTNVYYKSHGVNTDFLLS